MTKIELGSLIHSTLRHSLQQQEKVSKHKNATSFLSVIQKLAKFNLDLEEWYSGKFHLRENDRCDEFLRRSQEIEDETDRISEELWEYCPVSLVPHFKRIKDRRAEFEKTDSYPRKLRAQFNNFRIGLLEQVTGARFLENNSDLGDEVERILVQYLNRRIGESVRILRGGHIYDYDGNRSGQIDIIVIPANALGFCPGDTGDGKYNVMIDQVIAAISVTSRLTPSSFRERIQGLQGIPEFKQKAEQYPGLKEPQWPLKYVIGAECDDFRSLHEIWNEINDTDKLPMMMLLLDSGYTMQWSYPDPEDPDKLIYTLRGGEGIQAGLGLGWLEVSIAARNSWMTGQKANWLSNLAKQLKDLMASELPIHDPSREPFFWGDQPLRQGILRWGRTGRWAHNRLFVVSLFVRESTSVIEATLVDESKPFQETGLLDYKFEPRWFKQGLYVVNGDYCALEEWQNPRDREKHQKRIAVFNHKTGEEVTAKLSGSISECSELEQLNPILKDN